MKKLAYIVLMVLAVAIGGVAVAAPVTGPPTPIYDGSDGGGS
jgi:hypothetical protein